MFDRFTRDRAALAKQLQAIQALLHPAHTWTGEIIALDELISDCERAADHHDLAFVQERVGELRLPEDARRLLARDGSWSFQRERWS
jgi:hypothetical protein